MEILDIYEHLLLSNIQENELVELYDRVNTDDCVRESIFNDILYQRKFQIGSLHKVWTLVSNDSTKLNRAQFLTLMIIFTTISNLYSLLEKSSNGCQESLNKLSIISQLPEQYTLVKRLNNNFIIKFPKELLPLWSFHLENNCATKLVDSLNSIKNELRKRNNSSKPVIKHKIGILETCMHRQVFSNNVNLIEQLNQVPEIKLNSTTKISPRKSMSTLFTPRIEEKRRSPFRQKNTIHVKESNDRIKTVSPKHEEVDFSSVKVAVESLSLNTLKLDEEINMINEEINAAKKRCENAEKETLLMKEKRSELQKELNDLYSELLEGQVVVLDELNGSSVFESSESFIYKLGSLVENAKKRVNILKSEAEKDSNELNKLRSELSKELSQSQQMATIDREKLQRVRHENDLLLSSLLNTVEVDH